MTLYRRSPRPLALAIDYVRDELEPEGLLADLKRHGKKTQPDFQVEHFKPSLFERLLELLGLK